MLTYGQNSIGINQRHVKATGKPSVWTFEELLRWTHCPAGLITECVRDTHCPGRMANGVRVWTWDEAKQIIELATSTVDGSRYA